MRHLGGKTVRLLALASVLAAASPAACSRTGFEDLGLAPAGAPPGDAVDAVDAADAATETPDAEAVVDAAVTPPPENPPPKNPECQPKDEECNGKDDDCDGEVDEDLPNVPCPGGGDRYCVAGRYSACPERCEVCIPGSERVCFLSYCTYWATQTCAADGRSFGTCREHHVPPECEDVSSRYKDSKELEQCCLDNGYCCRDEYDLDDDGVKNEMLGRCDEVSCSM